VIALRARLEDLDGIPVININEPSLQGVNALVKRAIDIVISTAGLSCSRCDCRHRRARPADLERAAFFHQERMGLDGKSFTIVKFRSMHDEAEKDSGPCGTQRNDPRGDRARPVLPPFEPR